MVKFYPSIEPDHREWMLNQPVFFVASAPSFGKHVNISPKGLPSTSLAILSPNQAAYVDATGSGNETLSHVRENGRITVMFCSFESSPRILRLFCTGTVIEFDDPAFKGWVGKMGVSDRYIPSARAVIALDIFQVQTSCGYGVPLLALRTDAETGTVTPYLQDRDTLVDWAEKKAEKKQLSKYMNAWNAESLDGLPGLRAAMIARGQSGAAVSLSIALCKYRRPLEIVSAVVMAVLALRLAGCLKQPAFFGRTGVIL
ncbi:pyridoxamine phosphate oxidase [Trichophyton tonsurans CBS 112818]|uniref:Pyridoxamine phosphate oxidase family protein n=2 Tax=Trichophyton TaxID=5550 RepID=F2Q382_TRIEC|nr:pyridoxamine phosphate oxidase [Trichophyton tonsurans CBS 112818]EGE08600.1 pyridoxamine phosphate oxidase family protein [Trichophyton equinum CBS 127.97]